MRLLEPLVIGLFLLTSNVARAEPLLQPPSPKPVPNDDDPEPPLVPDAKDTLGGHFIAGASGAFVVPENEAQYAATVAEALQLPADAARREQLRAHAESWASLSMARRLLSFYERVRAQHAAAQVATAEPA